MPQPDLMDKILLKNNIFTTIRKKLFPFYKKKEIKKIFKILESGKVSNENVAMFVGGCVRNYINFQQRLITKSSNHKARFVVDGRDIGSVVFKKAYLKLYIEVDVNIRAKRRYKQLIDNGEKSIYRKILEDIKLRDKKDKMRKNSPLVVPKGAKVINNSTSFRNTTAQIKKIMESTN